MQPDAQSRQRAHAAHRIGGGGTRHHQAGRIQHAVAKSTFDRLVDGLRQSEIIGRENDTLHVADIAGQRRAAYPGTAPAAKVASAHETLARRSITRLLFRDRHVSLRDVNRSTLDMAYLPQFEEDIFVSYAHVDDEAVSGSGQGWVTEFVKCLKAELARKLGRSDAYALWVDHDLRHSQPVTPQILERVRRSAMLVLIMSPGYI